MTDIVFNIGVGAGALVSVLAAIFLLIRWGRHRYRFSIRALLLLFLLIGCSLFALMRFILPSVAHRLAIQNIYNAGGEVLFREDYDREPTNLYSDPSKNSAWRDVLVLHIGNDAQAVAVASQLKRLPEVESLILYGRVTDKGLAAIADNAANSSVNSMNVWGSRVTAAALSHLSKFKHLETLLFEDCPIDDSGLASLKSVGSLQYLTIAERKKTGNPNRFTDLGYHEIGQMRSLKNVNLKNLKISDQAARDFKNLTLLNTLYLGDCQISDAAVAELRQSLPHCEVVVETSQPPPPKTK